jgi:diguanylate cyclase (GGDEF)-like protein/PAS domain S-box-containing protein
LTRTNEMTRVTDIGQGNRDNGIKVHGDLLGNHGLSHTTGDQPPNQVDELRRTKDRLEAMMSALPDLMFRLDRDGRYLEYHSAASDRLYTGPTAFLGRKVTEVLPPEAARVLMAALEEAATLGRHQGGTYSLSFPQGEMWFELSVAAMGESPSADQEFVVLVRDITQRKRAEEEIQTLNARLEQRVTERTTALAAEIAERRRVDAELRISEQRYRLLAERSADLIWTMNLDGDLTYVSPAIERVLGFTPGEYRQLPPNKTYTPSSWARVQETLANAIASVRAGHPFECLIELENLRKDGSTNWSEVKATAIYDDAGRFVEFMGVTRDVTERKCHEDRLRESEERYRTLSADLERQVGVRTAEIRAASDALKESNQRLLTVLNAMEALIYIADMQTYEVLFLNQAAIRTFGPVEGQRCYRALQGLPAPCSFCNNDKLVSADGTPTGVYQWEFQNRVDQRWYDLRDCALHWTDGRLVRMEIATDITDRKLVEEQLRESEQRYRLIADNASDVIWTMDLDGRFTYVSPSVESLRGFTAAEAMRQSMAEALTPASFAVAAERFQRTLAALQAGQAVEPFRGELEQPCKGGGTVWTELTSSVFYDADGHCVGIIGITRDISERRRYEQALHRARDSAEAANRALQAANAELDLIATTDALTGARNRRSFEQTAAVAMAQAQRYDEPLSLVLFDIDHFKTINDRYGHQSGDQVLIELTQLVQDHLRRMDVLARWGGEEFVVLLPHCGVTDAALTAEKLRALVADWSFPTVGRVTASFGAGQLGPLETLDSLFKRVDDALYAAKEAGRNQVSVSQGDRSESTAAVPHLIWKPSFACGDRRIDDDHRELFRLANALLDVAFADSPRSMHCSTTAIPRPSAISHVTGS